jgi:hypothetical protein
MLRELESPPEAYWLCSWAHRSKESEREESHWNLRNYGETEDNIASCHFQGSDSETHRMLQLVQRALKIPQDLGSQT